MMMMTSVSSSATSLSSIDIFGRGKSRGGGKEGKRGPRGFQGPAGPRGPPGIDSIENIVRWFPKMAITETRYNEFCCLKISDLRTDLLIDKGTFAIKRWNSTTSKANHFAESLRNFSSKKYTHVNKDIYALNVNGESVYRIQHVELFPSPQKTQWAWTCITFRLSDVDGEGGGEQYLFSNYAPHKKEFRGLSVADKSIKIWVSTSDREQ